MKRFPKFSLLIILIIIGFVIFFLMFVKADNTQTKVSSMHTDVKKSLTFLKPVFSLEDSGRKELLESVVFSNDGNYFYQLNEPGNDYVIRRYEIGKGKYENPFQTIIPGLNNNYIYNILLIRDMYSEHILSLCIPYGFDTETNHWENSFEDPIEVVMFSKDLKILKRSKINHSEDMASLDFSDLNFHGRYTIHKDTISFMINNNQGFHIVDSRLVLFEMDPEKNYAYDYMNGKAVSYDDVTGSVIDKNKSISIDEKGNYYSIHLFKENAFLINDSMNKVIIVNLNHSKTFKYYYKSMARNIMLFDSGFYISTSNGTFEKYYTAISY